MLKNKTLEVVKQNNAFGKTDVLLASKKNYIPVKNSINLNSVQLNNNDVFLDAKGKY